METKKLLLLLLLISGLTLLAACAPEAATELPQEATQPYPAVEEGAVQSGDSDAPYPNPGTDIADDDPYPNPEEPMTDETINPNPYPPVEVVLSASDLDLSKAITKTEFGVSPSDKNLQAGTVFIEYSEIVLKESDPVQVDLILVGQLPTPCNQLRVVTSDPDENGHIMVDAYTVSDPEKMCTQVLEPFTAVIPLGEYTEGRYSLSINNEMRGEFTLP